MDASRAVRTRSVAPGRMGGHRKPVLDARRDWLLDQVHVRPEITVKGLQALLSGRGIAVSHDTVWRFLRRAGFSIKNVWPAPSAS